MMIIRRIEDWNDATHPKEVSKETHYAKKPIELPDWLNRNENHNEQDKEHSEPEGDVHRMNEYFTAQAVLLAIFHYLKATQYINHINDVIFYVNKAVGSGVYG